jgi:hypothetical protein
MQRLAQDLHFTLKTGLDTGTIDLRQREQASPSPALAGARRLTVIPK